MQELDNIITASNPTALFILSGMIGKIIVENSRPTPNVGIKGVLLGACLTHIGMNGLVPLKHTEQTATALSIPCGTFCDMICTTGVKDSLINVCSMITLTTTPISKVKTFDKEYDIKSQISWRYSSLYNQSHFNRFRT